MYNVEKRYDFLNTVGLLPRTIQRGLELLGVQEVVGKGSNATIMGWRDELNKAGHSIVGFTDDDIPWCGLFAAIVTFRAGKTPVGQPLWARNWARFGSQASVAMLGDVLVFVRESGGHVAFYIAEDDQFYHVLGGNQKNAVTITRIEKKRCIAIRRPPMSVPPASMKRYIVKASGTISTNEA